MTELFISSSDLEFVRTLKINSIIMVLETHDLSKSLLRNFGFDKFKGQQEEIIKSVLEGNDTFVTMPTGGGKSLCYQLPAMMMSGTAIIVSPLIALMKNQVDSVRSYANNDEVAHFLNSSLTKTQINKVKADIEAGKTKMLFIAPETLTKEENIAFLKSVEISMVAVDEAHCISEWGHDFRPEYRKIRTMINEISEDINIIALTATATPKVQSDIIKNLNMKDAKHFTSSFNRTNLFYDIRPKGKKENVFKNIVQQIKQFEGKSGIIYVQARKSTKEIADLLNVNGIKAAPYHAGLDAKTRSKAQDDFLMEDIDVIVATIAFGMGIDKPDVRFVIHYDIPKSIENYYQETGRAGRDGIASTCIAYYAYKDIQKLEKEKEEILAQAEQVENLWKNQFFGISIKKVHHNAPVLKYLSSTASRVFMMSSRFLCLRIISRFASFFLIENKLRFTVLIINCNYFPLYLLAEAFFVITLLNHCQKLF